MKRLVVLSILIITALAGCATQDKTDPVLDDTPIPGLAVPVVDVDRLLTKLESFSTSYPERAADNAAHIGAREFLTREFEAAGLDVWRQGFTNGLAQENIVGIKWGQSRDQWVVVGAHYDMASKECGRLAGNCLIRSQSQGAYDDGSGTMMVQALARAFANVTTNHTIAFVAFDGEERGLQGSQAFWQAMVDGDHPYGDVQVRAMLDLDMFGINYPGTIAPVYMDVNSPELQAAAADAWAEMGHPADMVEYHGISLGRSDYHWFMEAGIPTAFFISSFEKWELPNDAGVLFEATSTGTAIDGSTAYPFWHLVDTWDTMVAMAGSEEDLKSGFDAATTLASSVLTRMVSEDGLTVA